MPKHWALTRKGVALARTLGIPGAATFRAVGRLPFHDLGHLAAVNAFRFALAREVGSRGVRLAEFLTDADLRRRLGRAAIVVRLVPDGLFTLESTGREWSLALEVDFQGEPRQVVAAKAARYAHGIRVGSVHGVHLLAVVFLFARSGRLDRLAPILASLRPRSFLVGLLEVGRQPSFALPQVAWAEEPRRPFSLLDLVFQAKRTSPSAGEVDLRQPPEFAEDRPEHVTGELRRR